MSSSLLSSSIPSADGPDDSLIDYSISVTNIENVEIIFRNQRDRLLEFIRQHEVIFGAVAWFTDIGLVNALRGKYVAIVVQKEDILRPDMKGSKSSLRNAYAAVACKLTRYDLPGVAQSMSYAGSPEATPFRCVGNYNRSKDLAFPRMHNKFLIGGTLSGTGINEYGTLDYKMQRVWTGSYNFSYNAQKSFENALVLDCPEAAIAFASEWAQIFALSEPLNWAVDWIAPEYRIGS